MSMYNVHLYIVQMSAFLLTKHLKHHVKKVAHFSQFIHCSYIVINIHLSIKVCT